MPHDKTSAEIKHWFGGGKASLKPRKSWKPNLDGFYKSVYDPAFHAIVVMVEVVVFGFNAWWGVGTLVALSWLLIHRNKKRSEMRIA
ncbi:MAG: hypothetical protein KTV68_08065 [Acidimicrobiia bacterium]|nr:hypothetical protein [Acidimicrobiia bacterium]MCY4435338.1 hypothetical protein [bacterium]